MLMACVFWLGADQEAVMVTFAGVSTNDSKRCSFVITNSSKLSFAYTIRRQWLTNGIWLVEYKTPPGHEGRIPGQSAMIVEFPAFPENQWRIRGAYAETFDPSFVDRTREKVAVYANSHRLDRLRQWVYPRSKYSSAYGPEMIGNQPAPPAKP